MESERVADRLAGAAAGALVGREREREQLRAWVTDPDGPAAVFVHGPAGIGKTALVMGTLAGPATVIIDAREVEPTPATVLENLGDAFADASIVTLVIDSYERFGVVDGW